MGGVGWGRGHRGGAGLLPALPEEGWGRVGRGGMRPGSTLPGELRGGEGQDRSLVNMTWGGDMGMVGPTLG